MGFRRLWAADGVKTMNALNIFEIYALSSGSISYFNVLFVGLDEPTVKLNLPQREGLGVTL